MNVPAEAHRTAAGPRNRRKLELLMTAYHEAGHAVVAMALGRKFRRLAIVPTKSCAGHVVMPTVPPRGKSLRRNLTWLAIRAAVLYGGIAAEIVVENRSPVGMDSDLEQARRLCEVIGGEEYRERCSHFCLRLAVAVLMQPSWSKALHRLARALYRKRELRFEEAIAIVASCLPGASTGETEPFLPPLGIPRTRRPGGLSTALSPLTSTVLFGSLVMAKKEIDRRQRRTFADLGVFPFSVEKHGRAWWLYAMTAVLPFPVPVFYFTKQREAVFYRRLFNAAVADFTAASDQTIDRYMKVPGRNKPKPKHSTKLRSAA